MKEIINKNQSVTEEGLAKALVMYKETVSPSRDMLVNVLNQIPEKEKLVANDRRAIRSPYIWVAVTQFVSVCIIAVALYPTFAPTPKPTDLYNNDPFYAVDRQVDAFEADINEQDYNAILADYAK